MRTELKYVIPIEVLPDLRDAIAPFMQLDSHCRGLERRGYTVRSIYLDSPPLRYYHEKQNHLRNRKKLRIRGYNAPGGDDLVFLEIKRKFDSAISKERASIRYSALSDFFGTTSGGIIESNPDVGRRIAYHIHREKLLPTSLVVYEREAFQGRFDKTFRVTLDRNLRGALYPGIDGLFNENGLTEAMPGTAIVEVKYDTRLPAWLRPVIARFGLVQRSASKYCICIDLFEQRPKTRTAIRANATPPMREDRIEMNPIQEPAVDA